MTHAEKDNYVNRFSKGRKKKKSHRKASSTFRTFHQSRENRLQTRPGLHRTLDPAAPSPRSANQGPELSDLMCVGSEGGRVKLAHLYSVSKTHGTQSAHGSVGEWLHQPVITNRL